MNETDGSMETKNNEKEIQSLAHEVLILSRNTLLVNLRFLDMALSQLTYIPITEDTLLTDGRDLLYNPRHVLKNYRLAREIPTRDYLHVVMHCILRHMYMSPTLNRVYWDLACDIAVENAITELAIVALRAPREQLQRSGLAELRCHLKSITAEKIYRHLVDSNMTPEQAAQLRAAFYADNHEIWYMTEGEKEKRFGLGGKRDGNRSGSMTATASASELREIWGDIAKRIQVDIETFGKKRGTVPGSLTKNLAEMNREKYDYTSFLRKFAVMGEVMKLNADEFDNIFYTYGLQLYERMPLIEPLEYKEVKRIREFVIALDTSGSTHELAQKFVQKTYNILKEEESFFSKINLHIVQCDADIQEDKKITSASEFDQYVKTMKIRGLGGTDFRPVFAYVDELRAKGELTHMKGLIYFTDGYGQFPSKKPNYDVAFVFLDDDYNNYDVPPWAIKLILQKDEI